MTRTILLLALVLLCAASFAAAPPTDPILRIENGTHTATVWSVAADKGENFVVTGANDKTIRLWSLPDLLDGSLARNPMPLAVYRVPVGSGSEGMIYYATISPNGKYIACGGWTGYEWDQSDCIYIFDRKSGQIVKRIAALPDVIHILKFSKDGKYLAAGLGTQGLRVYSVSEDFKEAFSDTNYDSNIYGIDFSSEGWLATSCYDGNMRLYDSSFELKAKVAGSGKRPLRVAFSPDGDGLAVGYTDTTGVDILSGKDLSNEFSSDTSLIASGNLGSVAWNYESEALVAGGRYGNSDGVYPIMIFDEAGQGKPRSLTGPKSTIMDIQTISEGRTLFGSADPALGYVGEDGSSSIVYPSIADFRSQREFFSISEDGKKVGFGYKTWGVEPATFDTVEETLTQGDFATEPLYKAVQESKDIPVTDWSDGYEPKLRGDKLALKEWELSRGLSFSPDDQSFVLATEWYLRCFNKAGEELWNAPAPSVAWTVNVARNSKVCVAAFADGTIRWFNMSSGKELLGFFPHTDKKRWVLWTPSGYYDCSVGGEDIIGWHVNNGKESAADFFPASRFRDTFYRPDVVARVLDTLDESEAVKLADADSTKNVAKVDSKTVLESRPPVTAILSPDEGYETDQDSVKISYSVRSPSGEPVSKVRVLVDGRPAAESGEISFPSANDEVTKSAEVELPNKDCRISVVAENKYSISEPSVITIRRKVNVVATTEPEVLKPNLYVVAIGVSDYQNADIPKLKYAAKDAGDFVTAVEAQKGLLYNNIEARLLTDKDAVKNNILDALEWLEKQTTNKDMAMLFVAGHGANNERGDYHFLPDDFDRSNWRRTGVLWTEFQLTLNRVAGKAVFFIDTCDSGNVLGGGTRGIGDMTKALNELMSAENGVVVFTASSGKQVSFENDKWENGAFTKALIEGLTGKADLLGKGKITCSTLNAYVADRVKELTEGRQTPNFSLPKTVTDFPVAVVEK
jgi:WD40 repeat protein